MKMLVRSYSSILIILMLPGCGSEAEPAADEIGTAQVEANDETIGGPVEANDETIVRPLEPKLFVATSEGVVSVSESGDSEVILPDANKSYCLEVYGGQLFVSLGAGQPIEIYSLSSQKIGQIRIPSAVESYLHFKCLPDNRFALIDNRSDKIHFTNRDGELITSVSMGKSDQHSQDLDSVIVGGSLFVAEAGDSDVIEIPLDTYEPSVFRSLSGRLHSVSCLAFSSADNRFYASDQNRGLYAFNKETAPVRVSTEKSITMWYADVEVEFPMAFIMGTRGQILRMDLESGSCEEICNLGVRTRCMTRFAP